MSSSPRSRKAIFSSAPRSPATALPPFCWARSNPLARCAAGHAASAREHVAEFFVQDDWRATQRLTVNLGVRYTLNFPSTVADDEGRSSIWVRRSLTFGQNGFPRGAQPGEEQLRAASRTGVSHHGLIRRPVRIFAHVDRAGGHHDSIHDSAVSVHSDAWGSRRWTTLPPRLCSRKDLPWRRGRPRRTRAWDRACSPCKGTTAAAMRSSGT